MNPAGATSESALAAAYAAMADCYEKALGLSQGLPALLEAGDPCEHRLAELTALLGGVAGLDAQIAPLKRVWEASGRPAGPELMRQVERVAELLRKLAVINRSAEAAAQAQRSRLEPQVDAAARGHQMQRAYSETLSAERPAARKQS